MKFTTHANGEGIEMQLSVDWKALRALVLSVLAIISMPELARLVAILTQLNN